MPKGPWEKKGPVLPALSWSLTLQQNGEKPSVFGGVCCNHQCKIIQELVSDFFQSPALLLIREEVGSWRHCRVLRLTRLKFSIGQS